MRSLAAAEGDWNVRTATAMQVYRERLPVLEEPWKIYPISTPGSLYQTESRLLARMREADINSAFHAANPDAARRVPRWDVARLVRDDALVRAGKLAGAHAAHQCANHA